MILVVADTSPLNYLVQIDCAGLLPHLYQRILIPAAVLRELAQPGAPSQVSHWLASQPVWLEVCTVSPRDLPALHGLDAGETAAIQLALEREAGLLLIDERTGAKIARNQGLEVTGTLGVLLQAARRGFVDLEDALNRLGLTDFRHTPELFALVRQALNEDR